MPGCGAPMNRLRRPKPAKLTRKPSQTEWFGGVLWFATWESLLEVTMVAQIIPLLVVPMQGLVGNCLEEALSWVYGAPFFLVRWRRICTRSPRHSKCLDMGCPVRQALCIAHPSHEAHHAHCARNGLIQEQHPKRRECDCCHVMKVPMWSAVPHSSSNLIRTKTQQHVRYKHITLLGNEP